MQVTTINHNIFVILGFLVMGVTLSNMPNIPRSWWSGLKSWLSTNLGNIVASLNTAIQSSEKGAANGVATLGADSKIPEAQLPNIAIIDIITSAEATLADYIANEWSAGSIQKGDAVQITLANGSVELYQLFQNDGDAEADYKKIDASKVDWTNLLNVPDGMVPPSGLKEFFAILHLGNGTSVTEMEVLRNTIGGNPVISRSSMGVFDIAFTNAFEREKVYSPFLLYDDDEAMLSGKILNSSATVDRTEVMVTDNNINLSLRDSQGSVVDPGGQYHMMIQIYVYDPS